MRKTIALACILKDEVKNLPQLMDSIKDCFDEIHFTDTGSTDGSIELIQSWVTEPNPANSKVFLHHFKWVEDFSAARNASFEPAKTDYVMWLDLDDVLSSAENFISWRDSVMQNADFWLATYHYASDKAGNPTCSFARERVVKTSLGIKWKFFVHEGMAPTGQVNTQYAMGWNVVHKRTEEDLKKDRSRNLKLFEKKFPLCSRMQYYYGKELFENEKPLEAVQELLAAIAKEDLEVHDKIMGTQYACYSLMQLNQPQKAIEQAMAALHRTPSRAEYFVIIADCYLKQNRPDEAIPYYAAAAACQIQGNHLMQGAIFSHKDSYQHYPRNQLAKIYANKLDMDRAEKLALEALALGENAESSGILGDIKNIKEKAGLNISLPKAKSEAVLISCMPNGFYEWDEEIYKTKGIGGSETAAVEMAYWISKLTGREVKVFNNRKDQRIFDKVEYLPAELLPKYLAQVEPKVNIAWRHNIKLTNAPTYLWNHDLACPGIENTSIYEKLICLSRFHAGFVKGMFGVPESKIWVSRNGINPERFKDVQRHKQLGKVIFSSSPDRGLDRAIGVMDEVIKTLPAAELHCFYGFDNLIKAGRKDVVDRLKALVETRPYVKFHGNVSQTELTQEMASSQVWLYPTDFQETFCITALEAVACGTWPVVRAFGALPETLAPYSCDVLESENTQDYAWAVLAAMQHEKYNRVECDLSKISWESVAAEWIEVMGL